MTTHTKSNLQIQPLQNAHPGIDLARAVGRLIALKEKAGTQAIFTRKELIQALGFGPKSGGANLIISALVRFGFLQRIDTEYSYTELGTKLPITTPNTKGYKELLATALLCPELYNWLETKYGSDALPDEIEDILIGRYHDRNVRKDNVQSIITNYLRSVSFVKGLPVQQRDEPGSNEYISVSFRDNVVPIYKKYLLEAIQKTHDDELAKINQSLSDTGA